MQCNHFPFVWWGKIHAEVAYFETTFKVKLTFLFLVERYIIFLLHIIACDNGTFGDNCSQPCGNCAQVGQCHHTNGTCLEGCVDGFIGSTCTERMYF